MDFIYHETISFEQRTFENDFYLFLIVSKRFRTCSENSEKLDSDSILSTGRIYLHRNKVPAILFEIAN